MRRTRGSRPGPGTGRCCTPRWANCCRRTTTGRPRWRRSPPTTLVYADSDSIRPAHMVEFFALLGGGLRDADWDGSGRPRGRLAILPGTTHYDIFASPALAAPVLDFLGAPTPGL